MLLHAYVVQWRPLSFASWILRARRTLKAGGHARHIGCFGPSPHLVWEATAECNLKCIYCHAVGGARRPGELSFSEAVKLMRQAWDLGVDIFVFSGGEPLLRRDLLALIAEARRIGLNCFVATNGTLITKRVARAFAKLDVGVVLGLDAATPSVHDKLRGVDGAHRRALEGLRNSVAEDLYLHLNVAATRLNLHEVPKVVELGSGLGAHSFFIYFFKPAGRGVAQRSLALMPSQSFKLLEALAELQRRVKSLIIPVGAPHYWAWLAKRRGLSDDRVLKLAFSGCAAKSGMIYVDAEGWLTRCPFLQERLGNVKSSRLNQLLSKPLPKPSPTCSECSFKEACGGCLFDAAHGSLACPLSKPRGALHG